jgi:hypothetical protein
LNKKDALTIIVPVLSAVLILALTDLRIFHPTPDFIIKFVPEVEKEGNYKLTVANVGRLQAKNVDLSIVSSHSYDIYSIFCPEGVGTAGQKLFVSNIKFTKMSTSVECQIGILDTSDDNSTTVRTYHFSMTGDDSPGKQLRHDVIPQEPEEKSDLTAFFSQTSDVVFVTASILGGTMAVRAGLRIQRDRQEDRRLEERQTEIQKDLDRAEEELDFLERSIVDKPNVPSGIQERIQWLEERIARYNESLAKIRGATQTNEDTRVQVGDFFTKWAKLERTLAGIGERYGIDPKRPNNAWRTVDASFKNGELPANIYEEFQSLRSFRNDLVHGVIVPSEAELKSKISFLDKLSDSIESSLKK